MSVEELEVYAENTRSLMLYMNLHLLQVNNVQINIAASHLGRAMGICDVLKKSPYYIAVGRGYLPNDLMVKHNVFFDRIYSQQGANPTVVDEFYDVILELASYAKKHLTLARQIFEKEKNLDPELIKHAHRAFLLAQECEHFLELLELHNFNIFEPEFRQVSYVKTPYALYNAAKSGKF